MRSGLDVPTFATRRLHPCHHARAPSGGRWNCGRKMSGKFCLNADLHVTFRDLLHTVKLRHGTDVFTSSPKEGVLRIFFALKIRRLRPGANPRTWVPKAGTLPLDHRSFSYNYILSLTPALDGIRWSASRPGRFTPGKDPVPIVQEAGWVAGPVWTGAKNLAPTGIRSPDLPARSESLYRLS